MEHRRIAALFAAAALLSPFSPPPVHADPATAETLAAEVRAAREAGVPLTIEEIVPPDIPDAQNGAAAYRRAFDLLAGLKDAYKTEWPYLPHESMEKWRGLPETDRNEFRESLLKDPDFVEFCRLLHEASGMKCRFLKRADYEAGFRAMLPHLALLRDCARTLAARAYLRTEMSDLDGALRDCAACLRISDSLSDEPLAVSVLVGMAVDAIALAQIEETLHRGAAPPDACRTLLEALGRKRYRDAIQRAVRREMGIVWVVEYPRLGKELAGDAEAARRRLREILSMEDDPRTADEKRVAAAIRNDPAGFLEENMAAYLRVAVRVAETSRKPFPEAAASMGALEKEIRALPAEKRALMQLLFPAWISIFRNTARAEARLGNAAVALACRLYRESRKEYPASLKDLSPEFLPSPPADPFTGKDLVYRRTEKGFIVYSVGENMKDDGGRAAGGAGSADGDIVWRD